MAISYVSLFGIVLGTSFCRSYTVFIVLRILTGAMIQVIIFNSLKLFWVVWSRTFNAIWVTIGQEPTVFEKGAGGGCMDIFFLSLSVSLFFLPLSLGDDPI